ncbi:MAG: SPOR domain-containing protein [Methylococcales bacterium]|jgi:hypothetical protein|nr:SPOR domain-containing protein [Methylococcales bacterium]MBT7443888.1 SPOR domain-containing protein [Methylococcales bacterium]
MKWIFLALLFLNLALFFAGYTGSDGEETSAPEPSEHPLKLLNELTDEEKASYQKMVTEAKLPTVKERGDQVLTDEIFNASGQAIKKAVYTASLAGYKCQTLGPIRSFEQADQISRWFNKVDKYAVARKNLRQKHLGFWVVLPKLATMKDAKETLTELKASGIKDAYMFTKGRLKMYISLGLFNRRDHADTRKKELLESFQVVADIKPRIKDESDYWVDYKLAKGKKLPKSLQKKIAKESSQIQYKKWQCRVVAPES